MTRRSEPSTALRIIQAVRIAAALLLLAGLAGAAASAARRESLATFRADLDAGRVTEVLLAGPGSYLPPGAATDSGRFGRTVRWEVTGGGRRVAALSDGVGAADPGDWSGEVNLSDGSDLPGRQPSTEAEVEQDLRRRVEAAGVPVGEPGGHWPERALWLSGITALLLLLVLVGGPQPRRATKWAWFWLMLVPGGITQLAWLAAEAPWSGPARRRPEPRPHRQQPDDPRLTGGRAVLLAIAVGILLGVAGRQLAGWLAG